MNQSRPTTAWSFGPQAGPTRWTEALAARLMIVVDAGLAATICVAPFVFGGRHDLGRLVFVSLVAFTSIAWFARQCVLPQANWTRTWAFGILFLALSLVGLQLVPLPHDWLARLAPRTAELLPMWTAGTHGPTFGNWNTLSLTPRETTLALAMLVSYALLFTVLCQRIESTADVEKLLYTIAIAAVLMATFGLVQLFASNGKFFWFYVHPFRTTDDAALGSFMNRNHFAGFLVLGVGPLVRWLVASLRAQSANHGRRGQPSQSTAWLRTALLFTGLVIVLLAIMLSLSRGGAMALTAAALTVSAVYWRWKLIDSKYLAGFAAVVLLMLGLLSLYGYDQLTRRLDDFVSGSVESLDTGDARRRVWAANVSAIEHGGLFGSGVGSHLAICPVYLTEPTTKYYTHAENGYLQIVTENGLVGAVLLALGLALVGCWCFAGLIRIRDPAGQLCYGAAVAGIAASLVHSAVDFVWYVPACLSLTIALAAAVLRLSQLASESKTPRHAVFVWPRARWIECTVAVALAASWTVHTLVGPGIAAVHWERYQCDTVARARIFGDPSLPGAKKPTASELAILEPLDESTERHLRDTLAWDPSFAAAHLRLAALYARQFERDQHKSDNALMASQIRDAAFASHFDSLAAQREWLERAFGTKIGLLFRAQAHARRAIALSPLEGDGYVFLANLGFLAGGTPQQSVACIAQAERVRPYDGEVAFEAGKQAMIDGDQEAGIRYFARCFGTPGDHQLRIVGLLAGRVAAEVVIDELHPDWRTLRAIWAKYRELGTEVDLRNLVVYAQSVTERDAGKGREFRPAYLWLFQAQMYSDVGQQDRALACLNQAYIHDPHLYEVRRTLGFALQSAGKYAEAEPHLRWCLSRRPDDKALTAAVDKLSKQRVITHDPNKVTATLTPQLR
ncbi:MAG: O-antigen ligase family protein [Pirellulales bacterium]